MKNLVLISLLCSVFAIGSNYMFYPSLMKVETVANTKFIQFDRTAPKHVTIPDDASFSALTPITVVFYTNSQESNPGYLFAHYGLTGDQRSWAIRASFLAGTPLMLEVLLSNDGEGIGSGTNFKRYYTSTNVFDGDWHQAAFTFNASGDLKLYIDGVEQSTVKPNDDAITSLHDSTSAMTINAHGGGATGTNAGMNNAAIWNKELPSSELLFLWQHWKQGQTTVDLTKDSGLYESSSSLVYWARLGDGDTIAANGILDSSGNNNHGTPVNMVAGDIVDF